ncbi:tyrosine-protein phosphatase [Chitinophaga nivalis]|uniref:protein-tyrosine-phosphatase n=1 Tax=Chitinophaga nivalis TaxID=2991709 RepID=A0ABT3IPH5_9BACT|nr:CpsB/CapC family capsule biosynthesis tyrosine phosphatase [Chitinophaga nivalis]MCW3464675.1 histidinol phosphatase [Chitinophaga nivalis]MCW3485634.1 histidinol phosphatase [Chitinophaga nivalis]
MFFFRRRTSATELPAQLLAFMGTDIHSHLVPGIDDGVQETATAVHFIEQLQAMGINKIITTPHAMMDRYPNSADTIRAPFAEVAAALQAKGNNIPFHFAAEYYLDEQFAPLMAQPLLTLTGNLVLVEISFMAPPPQLHQWLFDLQAAGYQPVMAHPERYPYYHGNMEYYQQLKNIGCLLQVNLLSLTGYYGKHVQQAAQQLLQAGLADLTGTDLHHEKHLRAITGIGQDKKLRQLLEKYPFKNNSL